MSRRPAACLALLASLAGAGDLRAHAVAAETGDLRWWQHWNADPVILPNLVMLAALYAFGFRRLARQRGERAPVRVGQAVAFVAGMISLAAALLSPIDVLAAELQWVHMVQHMVLMNVAAPLFILGAPARVMVWALPPSGRLQLGRWKQALAGWGVPRYLFWQPVGLWLVYALVLWVWHVPALYEAALHHNAVHDLQHLMFFAVSALFWRILFDPIGRLRMPRAPAVVYLFFTSLHATVLGVFMALAPRLWYSYYAERTSAWGLPALEDQQLAGYIMWMPACMIYAVVAAVLFAAWLRDEEPDGGRVADSRP